MLSAGAAGDPVAEGRALGYQLDVSRCKVPTMQTLRRIVDILASLGYNQFQLYTEHTFAYSRHETAWRGASPMTPDEVRALDAYCAAKGKATLEVVLAGEEPDTYRFTASRKVTVR